MEKKYYNREAPPQSCGLEVRVRYTGNTPQDRDKDLEKALAHFKKLVNREGIMVELKERQYFRSDAEKKRDKRKKAIQRMLKNKKKRFRGNDEDKRHDNRGK